MYNKEIYELELKLKDYLNKHTEVIEEYLGWINHDFIKVNSVEIDMDDKEFSAHCQLMEGLSDSISPFIPIPEKFLRQMKLKKIEKL